MSPAPMADGARDSAAERTREIFERFAEQYCGVRLTTLGQHILSGLIEAALEEVAQAGCAAEREKAHSLIEAVLKAANCRCDLCRGQWNDDKPHGWPHIKDWHQIIVLAQSAAAIEKAGA